MTVGRTSLDVRGLSLSFGGVRALSSVDLSVADQVVCGLVGPNGAGKTCLFNCVSGIYRPSAGSVHVSGVDVLGLAPHKLAALGVSRTFQHPALQADATVLDNVLVGAHPRMRGDPLSLALRLPWARRPEQRTRQRARELLDALSLGPHARVRAGELPHGTRKRVELARALMAEPSLLLLDEPASGLPHREVEELGALIRRTRDAFRVTILLVEHHMKLISTVSDHVVALVEGHKVAEGSAAEVQRHPVVVEAYLGARQ